MTAKAAMNPGPSYDEVPYDSHSYPQTHIVHLHMVATLFGLAPPECKEARVLELGCAAGGNLIPQAMLWPKAQFTGLDFSGEQIAQANRDKDALGLKNVTFTQEDILSFDLKKMKGKFDYIIVHGVFSWVQSEVRDAILDICREALSSKGVAVISYNTLPGWNAVRSVREMMLYHTNRFSKPAEKVVQARALVEFLLENVPEGNAAYRGVLDNERKLLQNVDDSYLFHDHLESVNAQFYLHDFVRMANENELDYVGDSNVAAMFVGNMPQKAAESFSAVGDVVAQEQYMDFVNNRRFRSSILCRKGQKIVRELRPEKALDYLVAGNLSVQEDPAPTADSAVFRSPGGLQFKTNDAPSTALFRAIADAKARPLTVDEIVERAVKGTDLSKDDVRNFLAQHGMQMMLRGFLHFYSAPTPSAETVSDKPKVWTLIRHQVARPNCKYVTSMTGQTVRVDDNSRILLAHMDGTHDHKALADVLVDAINDGRLKATKSGVPVTDGSAIYPELEQVVARLLPQFAAQHLLVE